MNLTTETKKFYEKIEEVWPNNDDWHLYSKNYLTRYIEDLSFCEGDVILNAGSGGTVYQIDGTTTHLDIAENKISHLENHCVASIENIPLPAGKFSHVICVGSVINYTDALPSICELSRVLSKGGVLILEFENSYGFEHIFSAAYKSDAKLVTLRYNNEEHRQWVYSERYIRRILNCNNLEIVDTQRFHIISALHYKIFKDENKSARYTKFDKFFQNIPFFKKHSNNIIIKCKKIN